MRAAGSSGFAFGCCLLLALVGVAGTSEPAAAQQIDLSHGGPIAITAASGIEWRQAQQEVIANGDAKAVRGNVTVTADRLIAWYRKKGTAAGAPPPAPAQTGLNSDVDSGGNEIYRVEAQGHVHIYTQTDQVWGDQATYDMDQGVLVVTGHDLRLTTPNDVLTARDDLEYWSQRHMAVARGDAVVVTKDGRRLQADTLVAYTTDAPTPPAHATAVADKPGAQPDSQDSLVSAGKLQRVDAFGHVLVRTVTDTVTGDKAVYLPDTGVAVIVGKVRITRGQNQLDGAEAVVDQKTGVSRLVAGNAGRVQGLVVPNDQTNQAIATPAGQAAGSQPPGKQPAGMQPKGNQPKGTQ